MTLSPVVLSCRFCGEGLTRTIRSMKNTVVLTFRSDYRQVSSNNGFRLRATLFNRELNM